MTLLSSELFDDYMSGILACMGITLTVKNSNTIAKTGNTNLQVFLMRIGFKPIEEVSA